MFLWTPLIFAGRTLKDIFYDTMVHLEAENEIFWEDVVKPVNISTSKAMSFLIEWEDARTRKVGEIRRQGRAWRCGENQIRMSSRAMLTL